MRFFSPPTNNPAFGFSYWSTALAASFHSIERVGVVCCRCTGGCCQRTMAVTRTPQLLLTTTYLLLILVSSSHPCGPGRNYGTRKARKMTPLVFKQHVPNVSENTLGASGPSEGRITRQDPRFKDLVVNNNPNILFKDEEGTGVDRIMSQRCKDKLDALAILVRNHWPGVRLRVIEVWDETGHSPQESLHYEGRAADITTSDRDRSKYGMLARLAVNAGFDWVYYESRGYIHCSVRSDSSIAVQAGGCFPSISTVELETRGSLPMSELSIGDRVLTVTTTGAFRYEPVIAFLHQSENVTALVHSIETESGQRLTVTPDHLVYASEDRSTGLQDIRPLFAGRLRPNKDYVYVRGNDSSTRVVPSRVSKVTVGQSNGLFAPLTESGTIVVDDTLTSCYALVDSHVIAHVSMAPLRAKHRAMELLGSVFTTATTKVASLLDLQPGHVGVHWYAKVLYAVGVRIVPSFLWFANDPNVELS